jgi:Mor family transcriptional regulator
MSVRVAECRENWVQDFAMALQNEFSLNPSEAQERARALIERVCAVRPAGHYYWPAPDKRLRDEAIAREFNGRNLAEVKRKFGITSTSMVYSIRSKALAKRYIKK